MAETACTNSRYPTDCSTVTQYMEAICHRLAVKNYFQFHQNQKKRRLASLDVKRDGNGREARYLAQDIAKIAIKDARLARTRKPQVEIWRKPHKRTRITRLLFDFKTIYGTICHICRLKTTVGFTKTGNSVIVLH